jgi:large subunit ribosomal protein L13
MTKTTFVNVKEQKKEWHFIDADGKVLGRLAVETVKYLTGKNKAYYAPNEDFSDKVVITNAAKIRVTGKKLHDKMYYTHSRYAKGFKKENLAKVMEKNPSKALELAVKGMLPRNKLLKKRIANLYIYNGAEHPHKGQETVTKE